MRIYSRHERHIQRERDIAKVCRIIASGDEVVPVKAGTRAARNTAADARVLRMIPVTTEGVAGTIPGTGPLDALLKTESRNVRHGIR